MAMNAEAYSAGISDEPSSVYTICARKRGDAGIVQENTSISLGMVLLCVDRVMSREVKSPHETAVVW